MKPNQALSNQIKSLRQSLKESQEDFGKHFTPHASKGIVSKWENGNTVPSAERLDVISRLSGKSVEELLYGSLQGAINSVADYIYNLYKEYYDEFNRPKKEVPTFSINPSNSKEEYAFDSLSFIVSDSYTDSPKAWKDHQGEERPQYSMIELEEIRHYYNSSIIKGLSYCAKDTYQSAKIMEVKPYQTLLLFKLFFEAAKAHFEEHTRDNNGALNVVSEGLENVDQALYSLFHASTPDGKSIELDNSIDTELYSSLENLLEDWQDQIENLREQYTNQ